MNKAFLLLLALFLISPAFGANEIINANVGKIFEITITSNATTGYMWKLVSDPSPEAKVADVKYVASKPGKIGSGGIEVWKFKALKKGRKDLVFYYVRPWEKNQPPARIKAFTINVK